MAPDWGRRHSAALTKREGLHLCGHGREGQLGRADSGLDGAAAAGGGSAYQHCRIRADARIPDGGGGGGGDGPQRGPCARATAGRRARGGRGRDAGAGLSRRRVEEMARGLEDAIQHEASWSPDPRGGMVGCRGDHVHRALTADGWCGLPSHISLLSFSSSFPVVYGSLRWADGSGGDPAVCDRVAAAAVAASGEAAIAKTQRREAEAGEGRATAVHRASLAPALPAAMAAGRCGRMGAAVIPLRATASRLRLSQPRARRP